jgi:amidase
MPTLSLSHTAFVPHDLIAPFRGAPDGLLAGLTAAVKDMYDIVGTRTSGGSPDWLSTCPPASSSAAAVIKILDAGATVVGKTVCDEFFYSVTGANAHYGTPANPRAACPAVHRADRQWRFFHSVRPATVLARIV